MDRRSFMKFLGFAPATVAMGAAPAAAPVADATALAEIQRLKDLAEFHQAAREAEAKTLDLLIGLKNPRALPDHLLTADEWLQLGRDGKAVMLPTVVERPVDG